MGDGEGEAKDYGLQAAGGGVRMKIKIRMKRGVDGGCKVEGGRRED